MGLLERISNAWNRFKDLFPREVAISYDHEADECKAVYWSAEKGAYLDFIPPEPEVEPTPELPPVTHFSYEHLFGPRPSLDDDGPTNEPSGLFEPPAPGRIREIILEHGQEVKDGREYRIESPRDVESL